MLVLGLTGSLATGKTTVAAMFAEAGAAVFDADAAVHALYRGRAAPLIDSAFAGTVKDGVVNRALLAVKIAGDPAALTKLERLVHPLVHEMEDAFRARAASFGRRVAVLDIPLLLETGGAARVDAVVVAATTPEIQRTRVLARPGMTETLVTALIARQMPDAEKRKRAHFIVDTSGDFAATRRQVADILRAVSGLAAGR